MKTRIITLLLAAATVGFIALAADDESGSATPVTLKEHKRVQQIRLERVSDNLWEVTVTGSYITRNDGTGDAIATRPFLVTLACPDVLTASPAADNVVNKVIRMAMTNLVENPQ